MLNTLKKQKLNYETIYKRTIVIYSNSPNYTIIM